SCPMPGPDIGQARADFNLRSAAGSRFSDIDVDLWRDLAPRRSPPRSRLLARHEMGERLDVVLGKRIGDLRHDDIAAAAPRALLVVVQRLDDILLALRREARRLALALEPFEMALAAMTLGLELGAGPGELGGA